MALLWGQRHGPSCSQWPQSADVTVAPMLAESLSVGTSIEADTT